MGPVGRAFGFTYDPRGGIATISRPGAPSGTTPTIATTSTITRDNAGRIIRIQHNGKNALGQAASLANWAYTRDTAGLLTADEAATYTNDPKRRLTASTGTGLTNGSATSAWAYDAADRITSNAGTAYTYGKADQISSIGSRAFTYNAVGERLTDTATGRTVTTGWNQQGQLVSSSVANGVTAAQQATYRYDPTGLRVAKTNPATASTAAVITGYTWDRNSSVPMLLAAGTTLLVYAPDGTPLEQLSTTSTSGTATYTPLLLHTDQLGSVRLSTGPNGQSSGTAAYGPYGTVRTSSGAYSTWILGWAGEQRDTDTGLIYLRARYYDPSSGTFISRDSMFETTGSAYGYVDGDALGSLDPLGLLRCTLGGWLCTWSSVQEASDFSAGFGDAASFGLTRRVREELGVDDVVCYDSPEYGAGDGSGLVASAVVPGPSGKGRAAQLIGTQVDDLARWLGFRRVGGVSRGEKIFTDGKRYITQDVDQHSGGTWKMGKSPKHLTPERRMGTYDHELNRIGP